MKLAFKFFCVAYAAVMLTVGLGGFLLTRASSNLVLQSRIEHALEVNAYAGKLFLLQTQSNTPTQALSTQDLQQKLRQMVKSEATEQLNLCLLEDTANYTPDAFSGRLQNAQQGYAFLLQQGTPVLQVVCRADLQGKAYYIESLLDFSEVYAQQARLMGWYRYAVLAAALVSGGVLWLVARRLTRPLQGLSAAVDEIACQGYSTRIETRGGLGSTEVLHLAHHFNTMAQSVQSNVTKLQAEIEKREAFVADFTHELKTPMTSIIGYADLLRSYNLTDAERAQAANAIYRQGKRLEQLSMRLLDIMVLEKDTVELCTVHTKALFADVEQAVRFLPQKYGVKIKIQVQPQKITADPALLLSLLYNLTDNACKASTPGQEVLLCGRVTGEKYLFSVQDRGCGIAPENIERITQPFFMEDKSRARKQGGAGLGLALCQRICQVHFTRLEFESIQGRGTTVRFALPLATKKEASV